VAQTVQVPLSQLKADKTLSPDNPLSSFLNDLRNKSVLIILSRETQSLVNIPTDT
jgi:hypothetical protein